MTLDNKKTNHKQSRLLIVFAKAPEPGYCKTRLIPLLGKDKACEFYKSLVTNYFDKICTLQDIDISIHISPDINNEFLQKQINKHRFLCARQQGSNLGDRMYFSIHQSLQTYSQVVLTGTDCPSINNDYIERAFNALSQHDIVFGPAEDGGYVLIGASKIHTEIFTNIDWSTNKVFQQSLAQADKIDYSVEQLNTLRDIDTSEDYIWYQSTLSIQ